jgi:hypothetical protein
MAERFWSDDFDMDLPKVIPGLVVTLPQPVPTLDRQGLWYPPPTVRAAVEQQLLAVAR